MTRVEGAGLLGLAVGLLIWLYRASPVFLQAERDGDGETEGPAPSRVKAIGLLSAASPRCSSGRKHRARGYP